MKLTAHKKYTAEGWYLVLPDGEVIAGPTVSEDEIVAEAELLDLEIQEVREIREVQQPFHGGEPIGNWPIGTLFSIGDNWYRLMALKGKKADLRVIGPGDRTETLPLSTPVSAISVLSLK